MMPFGLELPYVARPRRRGDRMSAARRRGGGVAAGSAAAHIGLLASQPLV